MPPENHPNPDSVPPEDTSPGDVPQDTAPQDSVPQGDVPQAGASQGDTTRDGAPDDVLDDASQHDVPQHEVPQDIVPGDDVSHDDEVFDAAHDDIPAGVPDAMPDQDMPDEDARYDDEHVVYFDAAFDDIHTDDGALDDAYADYGRDESSAWKRLAAPPGLRARWLAQLGWHARWVIYVSAFAIPLALLGVLFGLTIALDLNSGSGTTVTSITATPDGPTPTATFAVTPQWPAALSFAAHTTPARIRNTLGAPGIQHGYRFDGRAGEVWIITVEPYQNSAADPQLKLYGPTGARICHDQGCAAGEPRSQIALVLEISGTYRLVVESASGTGTGLYLLTLDDG